MMPVAPLPPGGGPHQVLIPEGHPHPPPPRPRERLSWLWWVALVLILALAATAAILLDRTDTAQDGLAPPLVDARPAPTRNP
jgi:hypothetical protein